MYPRRGTQIVAMAAAILLFSSCETPSVDQATAVPRRTPTATAQRVPTQTSTLTPFPKSTAKASSTVPPTLPPRPSPTNTELPKLPDFSELLSFGGGGGGGACFPHEYPTTPDSIHVTAGFGFSAALCIFLRNVDASAPLRISLSQLGGSGMTLWSPDLVLDRSLRMLYWQFQLGERIFRTEDSATWADDGSVKFRVIVRWPVTMPPGNWQVTLNRSGGPPVNAEFQVTQPIGKSYVSAMNGRAGRELMPGDPTLQTSLLPDGGPLGFVGSGYPPDVPVFVLLYQYERDGYRLMEKKLAIADGSGAVRGEFSASYASGDYILYGITNPQAVLSGGEFVSCHGALQGAMGSACDMFGLMPTSCPGAPDQQMVLGHRGHVCTQSDTVRLRVSPLRSADAIQELPPATQFTVLGGPHCANDWSWWYVRLDDGTFGWIAEGGDAVDPYFICPGP